ncbi:MAG: DNA-3-methyladenine glycosylase [Verrucomicrobia bacterium]|nr:DNA-3-methyladenine glycosylase [Verrucomicrobiota bacterium]
MKSSNSMQTNKIPLSFYREKDVVAIAKSLIGKYLFTCIEPANIITGGMIIETEAYKGAEDRACHAFNNLRTKRTEVMYAAGGLSYVYLCYGMHHLFNIVTNEKDVPHAILIRAIKPEIGIEVMLRRRGLSRVTAKLASGPGAMCKALGITTLHNGMPLDGTTIWLEDRGAMIAPSDILTTPRIGIDYAGEDVLNPWRFLLQQSDL